MSLEQPKPAIDTEPSEATAGKDNPSADTPAGIERSAGELRALGRMVVASQDTFSLSLAVCNSPASRDRLIEQLSSSNPGIQRISIPAGTIDVYGFVRQETHGRRPTAICIVDYEKSLPSEAHDWPTLRSLNASRELWAREFSLPVILWLPSYAAALLAKYARDLWAWFSHQFDFAADETEAAAKPMQMISSAATDTSNLDADRKRLRIAELQQRVRDSLQSDDPLLARHVSQWLMELGHLHYYLGSLDQAEQAFSQATEVNRKMQDDEGLAVGYGNLGNVYQMRGNLELAEKMFGQALEIHKHRGRLDWLASDYGNLGSVFFTRGNMELAERMYHQSLEIEQKLGRLEGMACDYGNLGNIYLTRGSLEQAENMYRKALEINQKLGRKAGTAIQYGNLGGVYKQRGDLEQAEKWLRQALEIDEKLGRLEGMANHYTNLGILYETKDNKISAREMWSKALELYRQIGAAREIRDLEQWLKDLPADDLPS